MVFKRFGISPLMLAACRATSQACCVWPVASSLRADSVAMTASLADGCFLSSSVASLARPERYMASSRKAANFMFEVSPAGGVTSEVIKRFQRLCSADERGGISNSLISFSTPATSRPRHSSNGRPEPSAAIAGVRSPFSTGAGIAPRITVSWSGGAGDWEAGAAGALGFGAFFFSGPATGL